MVWPKMAWNIYRDRNAWLRNAPAYTTPVKSAAEAKSAADGVSCTHVSNGSVTYAKGPDGKWRRA